MPYDHNSPGTLHSDDRLRARIDHTELRGESQPWWSVYSRPLRVLFPEMNTPRDIQHGLSVIPDGFLVLYTDADIVAAPGVLWTVNTAYLIAGGPNARAVVIFYTLREGMLDA